MHDIQRKTGKYLTTEPQRFPEMFVCFNDTGDTVYCAGRYIKEWLLLDT